MTKLNVPDISCGHCKAAIEKTIAALDPNATVDVDLENRTVTFESSTPDAEVMKAIEAEGYPSTVAS